MHRLLQQNPNSRQRARADGLFRTFCFGSGALAILILVALLVRIGQGGYARLSWDFITSFPSTLRPETAGIYPAVVGSFAVILLTAILAVPVGVAAAVYLEEFQTRRNRVTDFIQLNIANLAGVPSIVYGMLGLAIFAPLVVRLTGDPNNEKTILVGALTMAILILPIVILVTQEALKAVPRAYREGSLALGATKWQTIYRMVLRNALPGILTGVILAVSRAIGETAPLIVVGAVGLVPFLPDGPLSRYTVLPLQIFDWAGRPQEVFHEAAGAAIIVLMAVLLVLNSAAIIIRSRAQKKT